MLNEYGYDFTNNKHKKASAVKVNQQKIVKTPSNQD